jgi:hypothetical protein
MRHTGDRLVNANFLHLPKNDIISVEFVLLNFSFVNYSAARYRFKKASAVFSG